MLVASFASLVDDKVITDGDVSDHFNIASAVRINKYDINEENSRTIAAFCSSAVRMSSDIRRRLQPDLRANGDFAA
jgi:hypothetical protein